MKPWEPIERAAGPAGEQFELVRRGDEYVIRANNRVLMSSRQHRSEEAMAEVLAPGASGHVLIGGLGLGYTLRAVLNRLGPTGSAEVAELSDAVIGWNRGVLGPLAGDPLRDARVTVRVGDVGAVIRKARAQYDAVLLDVDNGPEALTTKTNESLYEESGLAALKKALKPGGVAVFWSAAADGAFRRRLVGVGFRVEARTVRGPGVTHWLFEAR